MKRATSKQVIQKGSSGWVNESMGLGNKSINNNVLPYKVTNVQDFKDTNEIEVQEFNEDEAFNKDKKNIYKNSNKTNAQANANKSNNSNIIPLELLFDSCLDWMKGLVESNSKLEKKYDFLIFIDEGKLNNIQHANIFVSFGNSWTQWMFCMYPYEAKSKLETEMQLYISDNKLNIFKYKSYKDIGIKEISMIDK